MLRQKTGSELAWVTFIEYPLYTEIKLEPGIIAEGTYVLNIESYDDNSSVKSTLKAETITVQVQWDFARTPTAPAEIIIHQNEDKTVSIANIA